MHQQALTVIYFIYEYALAYLLVCVLKFKGTYAHRKTK